MPCASHLTLHLARFDALRPSGTLQADAFADLLFCGVGADVRAAGTEPASHEAFTFVLLALHPSAEAARRFLDARAAVAPWLGDAAEVWSAVLQPFRHIGEANFLERSRGGPLFDGMAPPPAPDEPIVVVTSAGFRLGEGFDPERVQRFSVGTAAVRVGMTAVDGLHSQQSFFFPGVLEHDPVTVTTWRDFDAMRTFAYAPGAHRRYLDRHRAQPMADRTSFTRCRILHSTGTWYGAAPDAWAQNAAATRRRT